MGLNAVVARPIDNSDLFSTRARLQFFPSFLVPRPALSCFRYRNKSFTRASIIEHVPRRKQHHSPPLATKPERRGRELNSSFLARTADISRRNPVIRSRSFYGQTRLEMRFARNRGVAHSISYDDAFPPPILLSFDRSIPRQASLKFQDLGHFEKGFCSKRNGKSSLTWKIARSLSVSQTATITFLFSAKLAS